MEDKDSNRLVDFDFTAEFQEPPSGHDVSLNRGKMIFFVLAHCFKNKWILCVIINAHPHVFFSFRLTAL